ncbi:MAG: MBL fold metallo-hydrolase [Gammaproteobacteria bacterium]|nr:MBL fold metallo-hydrolase [Gammaproteobacteria bacterium]
MNNSLAKPNDVPPLDQLEVSLFGPGVGECIVIHIGNGEWVIVDSCKDSSGSPIALSYLSSLGVDPACAVKFIIVSHWHDDHIKGLAETVRVCEGARVVFSAALMKTEFLTLVDVINTPDALIDRGVSGLNEMDYVVKQLHRRILKNGGGKNSSLYLTPATADKRLYISHDVELWCLSPSDGDFVNALSEFGSLTNQLSSRYRGVIPSPTSNRNAVALWVTFGEIDILLGADLENSPHPDFGWSAIVNSSGRPRRKAAIFKVPHHGSKTAHNDDVVENVLSDSPISMLTTFNRGITPIPTQDDVDRIKAYSMNTFLTTPPKGKKPRRDSVVEKMMKQVVTSRNVISGGAVGHVRVRVTKTGHPQVRLDGPAVSIP